ncbi:helicase C-terminal domain-containing protein [Emericellopsis atlantica]|uniref:ATP-dependent DNA helicase CHL1 n=1 Tax=Emericellopsis atlantica TaxID=2614577 RepID=A0A9P7ZCK9_9HYPO|nr:helicase C-terminal domain-containing protein [Emericellopsis atlantica]KAG9249604.1 helicase C-terminal domain-containing protein [Emericellopsis atlantica]
MGSESMEDISGSLQKLDFHHPYTPYHVQEQFMRTVYNVLEAGNGQVGILESPTGTGKSLSLICATLTWLRAYKSSRHEVALSAATSNIQDEPEWIIDQMLAQKRDELLREWEDRERRLEQLRTKEKALETRVHKRRRLEERPVGRETDDEDAAFLLQDTESPGSGHTDALSGLSKESREILGRFGIGGATSAETPVAEQLMDEDIKIYYTSRTHSQLSQFITELRRPTFPPSLPKSMTEGRDSETEAVKLLPFSSRQRLCINPSVAKLGSVQAINDRCAELQQQKSSQKCPYVPKDELLSQTHEFRDSALASIPDIEDLHQLGKSLGVCPYYASRTALPGAEIITLPYPLLLQESARDALGIKLDGNVVVIDEAHNIMDAIANVHAADIRLSDMKRAKGMLGVYVRRFGKKLGGVNRVNVGRVGRIIEGLSEWMQQATQLKQDNGIVDANDLTRHKGIDQINMFELIKYIHESKLAFKIQSYVAHVESENDPKGITRSSTPVLHSLVAFLVALTNLSSEGRIFFERTAEDVKLSYLLLSPTHAFSSIADNARAVILAGGTMSPFEDYENHLFPSLAKEKVTTLSCDHVIPPENLCVRILAQSRPGNPEFEFSFQKRSDRDMITQLGLAVVNACSLVPDGVVIFFPSYGYLDEVVSMWQQNNNGQSIWSRLESRKALFREAKGASSDEMLAAYTDAIIGTSSTGRGALLLSVVGGKMSEGINFSDRLGRCVMVVGLPYPNIASPDWKAKLEYIESTTYEQLTGKAIPPNEARAQAKASSRDFYENACMRAVNQSIGRAIRHRGDYAAIVLVDKRFGSERIRGKLPGWIRSGMDKSNKDKNLGELMSSLGTFFRNRK